MSNEKLFLKKIKTKLIFSRLAKTLSAGLQLNIFEDRQSTISTVAKTDKEKGRERGEEGEGRGGVGHIYIPRSSTRTSGHEMQKNKNRNKKNKTKRSTGDIRRNLEAVKTGRYTSKGPRHPWQKGLGTGARAAVARGVAGRSSAAATGIAATAAGAATAAPASAATASGAGSSVTRAAGTV